MSESVLIAGLPGCGKSRWIAARKEEGMPIELIEWQAGGPLPADRPVWTLIDLRGEPTAALLTLLNPLLHASSAVIGVFAEESDLEKQTRWRAALRPCKNGGDPIHFSHYLQAPFFERLSRRPPAAPVALDWPPLQSIRVQLGQVVLEHLLFVLEGLVHSTNMRFWRIQGVLETLEYANPVAVEGSLAGLWTHAGEAADGTLHLWVERPDLSALQEGLRAVLAPGQDMDIRLNPE